MNIRIFLLFYLINLNFSSWAQAWPSESLNILRDQSYGSKCRECTTYFSENHCVSYCCESCNKEAITQKISIPGACGGVCSQTPMSSPKDIELVDKCSGDESADDPSCDGATQFVNSNETREFERRVQSCNEAVRETQKNCSVSRLNSLYPEDVFRLAKDIAEGEASCNLEKNAQYNLKPKVANTQEALGLCKKNYEECKFYCFDNNAIGDQINNNGQQKFENQCQPLFAQFEIRDRAIRDANDFVLACGQETNTTDDVDVGDFISPGDEKKNNSDINDPEIAKSGSTNKGTDSTANSRSLLHNPNLVMGGLSQVASALQAFLPPSTNSGGGQYYNTGLNQGTDTYNHNGSQAYEEYYPDYEGSSLNTADDMEFQPALGFDQPKNLKNTNPQNNQAQSPRGGMGGGGLGLGGMGSGRNNTGNAPRRGRPRAPVKDKTMFGKRESGGGAGGFQSGSTSVGSYNRASRGRFNSKTSSSLNGKKEFDASKYHNMILASYQKGMNSKAQKMAERRAAGLSVERASGPQNGYSEWHLENKIHPETVSLFLQTRMCYYTKYTSNFLAKCERKNR